MQWRTMKLSTEQLKPFVDNPDSILEQSLEFQLAVASYFATPQELIRVLVDKSKFASVQESASAHVSQSGELSGATWLDGSLEAVEASKATAQNDALTMELLKFAVVPDNFIADWTSVKVLGRCMSNPHLPSFVAGRIAQRVSNKGVLSTRLQSANSDASQAAIEILAGDINPLVRDAARQSPKCQAMICKLIDEHRTEAVEQSDVDQLALLAGSCWSWVRYGVANNDFTPSDLLDRLAEDQNATVRLSVAINPKTSAATLQKFANEEDEKVALAVIKHPNTDEETLLKLSTRFKTQMRSRANNLSPLLWEILSEGDDSFRSLFHLSSYPAESLHKLAEAGPPARFHIVAQHPNTSAETLQYMANNWQGKDVLASIAAHENCPMELRRSIWAGLLKDGYGQIEIARNSLTPPEVLLQIGASADTTLMVLEHLKSWIPEIESGSLSAFESFMRCHTSIKSLYAACQNDLMRKSVLDRWNELIASLPEDHVQELKRRSAKGMLVANFGGELEPQQHWSRTDENSNCLFGFLNLIAMFDSSCDIDKELGLALLANKNTPVALREKIQSILESKANQDKDYGDHLALDIKNAILRNPATSDQLRWNIASKLIANEGINAQHEADRTAWLERMPAGLVKELLTKYPSNRIIEVISSRAAELSDEGFAYVLKYLSGPNMIPTAAASTNLSVERLTQLATLIQKDNAVKQIAFLAELIKVPSLAPDQFRRLMLLHVEALEQMESRLEPNEQTADHPNRLQRQAQALSSSTEQAIQSGAQDPLEQAKATNTSAQVLTQLASNPDSKVRQALVYNHSLPLEAMKILARDPEIAIKRSLAYNINSKKIRHTEQVMEVMAGDSSEIVRTIVAENVMSPPSVLAKLSEDTSSRVRSAVARNIRTPEAVLDRLHSQHKLVDFKNPSLPATVFERVMESVNQGRSNRFTELRSLLSGHPDSKIPEHILSKLAIDADRNIRILVAKHPRTPGSSLAQLVLDQDDTVRKEALAHKNTPTGAIAELFAKAEAAEPRPEQRTEANVERTFLRSLLEKRGRLSDDSASLLAKSPYWQTRAMVAGSQDVSPKMLVLMIENESDLTVLSKIALNPMCNESCLDKLMSLNNFDIEAVIAKRNSCPPAITDRLIKSESRTVRRIMAQKAGLGEAGYRQLLDANIPEIKTLLARNSACPNSILEFLAQDDDDDIRFAIARNPQTSSAVLERMRHDSCTTNRTLKVISLRTDCSSSSERDPVDNRENKDPADKPKIVENVKMSPKQLCLDELVLLAESDLKAALSACAQSEVPYVRFCSLLHPKTSQELLVKNSRSPLWIDRLAVSLNSSTYSELLKVLVFDGNRFVRAAARHNKNISRQSYAEESSAPPEVEFEI